NPPANPQKGCLRPLVVRIVSGKIGEQYIKPPLHQWSYRWGVLPLHFAARCGRKEVIKALIKHGYLRHYDLRCRYRYALAVAAQNNNEGALEAWLRILLLLLLLLLLLWIVRVTVAIQYGLPDVVRHFVELGGFDIHMHREVFFKGLLMTAILECNAKTRPQVVRLLLENGVDPNHTFTEGRQRVSGTPLQRAILKGDLETTRSLVEYGADVNATSVARHGRWNRVCSLPPLIHAMRRRSAEIIRVLLENGANRTCLSRWQTLLVKAGEEKVSDEDIVIRKGMDQAETYSFVVVKQRSKKRKGKKLDD
ncbi:isoform Er9 of ankyrin-1, partial [Aspergillus lentulus]